MSLFLSLLPLYVFGNIHCLGMCGPLVVLIGQHRHRMLYFLGRLLSFGAAGLIAGGIGAVLQAALKPFYLAESISFVFGILIFIYGLSLLRGWNLPRWPWLSQRLTPINLILSKLMLKDVGWSTFLFGFATILLPCGQTLVVFSACALTGSPLIGLGNGLAFALLTSPSLFLAMHAHQLFKKCKQYYNVVLGFSSMGVGLLACCRGLAEMGWISHWVLNPASPLSYHIVIF